jgi:hypothetical protein
MWDYKRHVCVMPSMVQIHQAGARPGSIWMCDTANCWRRWRYTGHGRYLDEPAWEELVDTGSPPGWLVNLHTESAGETER